MDSCGTVFLTEITVMTVKVSPIKALIQAIDFASQSHRVTGQNLANINTPGYQSREVQFDQLLNRLDGGEPADAEYQVTKAKGLAERADGNNVDLDREMGSLRKNALAHQTLTQLLGSKMSILQQAIRG